MTATQAKPTKSASNPRELMFFCDKDKSAWHSAARTLLTPALGWEDLKSQACLGYTVAQ